MSSTTKKYEIKIGDKNIIFETKNWAERANAEAMVRCGDTQLLATVVMSSARPGAGFFPLTVNYEERYYASGKILGSRYLRRESRPSDNATTISRLIDRTIRPAFPQGFKKEVQVIITCLSIDEENDPDILGILAASAALCISDIPWQGPIGAVRVGKMDAKDQFALNPTYEQREAMALDIIFAGRKHKDEILINMIEAAGSEVAETIVSQSAVVAVPEIKKLIELQEKIQREIGKEKIVVELKMDRELENEVKQFLGGKIEKILFKDTDKLQRRLRALGELKEETLVFIGEDYPDKIMAAGEVFEKEVKKLVHNKALKEEKRIDGRRLDEVRNLECETGVIPRAHGSGLFSRGVTRSLSILTLGGPREQQLIEGMEITEKKRFFHHYNFPPYSVGETKPLRAPCRREIGHGMLAEKALLPVIPDLDEFPYTIRIVSEMLCSNGSTSMASICSSSLSLMDAGVPIKRPVAGIAIGLVAESNSNNQKQADYKLLTDIQGPEDFHGEMDLKVGGTRKGITAIQMDVKATGIDQELLKQALGRAKQARLQILDTIEKTIAEPRPGLSPFAPKIFKLQISPEKIGDVIGSKGKTIKKISEDTGVTIDIDDSGLIFITSENKEGAEKAIAIIEDLVREAEVGDCFLGEVRKTFTFGTMIELNPNQKGLLSASQCKEKLKVGDKIDVRVVSIDGRGRINLELKNAPIKKQSEPHDRQHRGRKNL